MNTTTLLGVSVKDADGNLFPDAVLTSASGFDYSSISNIPEPTAFALMGLGLAGIGFARMKKQN